MKKLILVPSGWQCTLKECPAGLFVYNGNVCFKSKFKTKDGYVGAYCDNGETFWDETIHADPREQIMVQPVTALWESE